MPMKFCMKQQQRGPFTTLTFSVVSTAMGDQNVATEPINIQDLALVRLKFQNVRMDDGYHIKPNISYKRNECAKDSTVKINITCDKFEKQCICPDDWCADIQMERRLRDFYIDHGNSIVVSYCFDVNITVKNVTSETLLASIKLYEDTEFTDFQLHTTDGTVAVHKALLSVHSDVFKTMLRGEWQETKVGRINMEGVTVQTLRHLKDYMYLGLLPEVGLESLLLVAARYLIDKLETDCIAKLVRKVTADKLDALVDFAFQNNIPGLVKAILLQTPDSILHSVHLIKMNEETEEEIRNYCYT